MNIDVFDENMQTPLPWAVGKGMRMRFTYSFKQARPRSMNSLPSTRRYSTRHFNIGTIQFSGCLLGTMELSDIGVANVKEQTSLSLAEEERRTDLVRLMREFENE